MKKKLIIVVSILAVSLFSCKKDVIEKATSNYVKVTLIDSSTVNKWIEVRPEKTQPYFANGFSGTYCTSATKVSTFNYADSFGSLYLYQSKALAQWKFYVMKNGVVIDNQVRQNEGIYYYPAQNGDEFLIVAKD